jgi:hypothetical protein
MAILDRAKIAAEIAKLGSEIYGLIVDKSRSTAADKARIKDLERQLAELKARSP